MTLNPTHAIRILRILKALNKHPASVAILASLGLADDYDAIEESLREYCLDHLVECGECGHHHREEYDGDCREDTERF